MAHKTSEKSFMKIPTLRGRGFILRPIRKNDEKDLIRYLDNKKISRYMTRIPYPYTSSDAKKWTAETTKEQGKKNPKTIVFAIEKNGELVGTVGLFEIKINHRAALAYWLAEPFWKQGIMTDAIHLILRYARREFYIKRFIARTFLFNTGSQSVLLKNGFQKEGLLRKDIRKNGKFYDAYLFAKVK